jgi:hypothetical protein
LVRGKGPKRGNPTKRAAAQNYQLTVSDAGGSIDNSQEMVSPVVGPACVLPNNLRGLPAEVTNV